VAGAPHFLVSHWLLFCAATALGAGMGMLIRKWRRSAMR
jgi:hypothetical protein